MSRGERSRTVTHRGHGRHPDHAPSALHATRWTEARHRHYVHRRRPRHCPCTRDGLELEGHLPEQAFILTPIRYMLRLYRKPKGAARTLCRSGPAQQHGISELYSRAKSTSVQRRRVYLHCSRRHDAGLHKRVQGRKIVVQLIMMLIGLGLMGWLKEC